MRTRNIVVDILLRLIQKQLSCSACAGEKGTALHRKAEPGVERASTPPPDPFFHRLAPGRRISTSGGPVGEEIKISGVEGKNGSVASDGTNYLVIWTEDMKRISGAE